jgi:hypothetical protein
VRVVLWLQFLYRGEGWFLGLLSLEYFEQRLGEQLSLKVITFFFKVQPVALHVACIEPLGRGTGSTTHSVEIPHCNIVGFAIVHNDVPHSGDAALDGVPSIVLLLCF